MLSRAFDSPADNTSYLAVIDFFLLVCLSSLDQRLGQGTRGTEWVSFYGGKHVGKRSETAHQHFHQVIFDKNEFHFCLSQYGMAEVRRGVLWRICHDGMMQ